MQPRHDVQAEERPVPMRRVIAWIAIALVVLAGIALFFRYAPGLNPLLG
jgi:hypothetical protein